VSKYDKLQIQKQPVDRKRGPGRPKGGKTSDPAYISTTILLRKELKKRLQMRALEDGRDLSDIVGELVEAWLTDQPKL
jgi:hypothetical protein